MADIFDEVEEDLRRDRLKKVWDRFAPIIIGGAVLIVVGIGGWRVYQYFQAERAAADGARYLTAMNLSSEGKHAEAAAAFAALAQDGTAGYRTVARLRAAAELAGTDPKAAIAAYDAYANDNAEPTGLRDVARLRAGYLLVDNGTYPEARQRVESLATPGNPFRHGAREVLGLAAFKSGDWAEARRWFEALVSDPDAPGSARQRGDLVLDVIGAANAPPPLPPPPPTPPTGIDSPGGSLLLPSLTAPTIPTLPSGETTPSFEPPAQAPTTAPPPAAEAPATPQESAAPPAPVTPTPDAAPTVPATPPAPAAPVAEPAPPVPAPPATEATPSAPTPEAAPAPPAPAAPEATTPAPPAPEAATPAAPAPPAESPPAVTPTPDGSTPPATAGSTTEGAPAMPPPASSSESPQ